MTTTFDFGDGRGPVPAHRHRNPDGSEGGWVAETASVASTAFVDETALVYDQAQVSDQARVSGEAQVCSRARVCGTAVVCGKARVSGAAWVSGEAQIFGKARVRETPVCLHGLDYPITITEDWCFAGCEGHSIADWRAFSRKDIERMDPGRSWEFWVTTLEPLLDMLHPREDR